MPLDPSELALLDEMKQRELNIKRKKRATDAIQFRERRFRAVLATVGGIVFAGLVAITMFAVARRVLDRAGWRLPAWLVVTLCLVLGIQLGMRVLRTRLGRQLMARRERALRKRYAEDINSGRRSQQYYYKGEDIGPFVPQILYFLESDPRFTTIDEALAFAKANQRASTLFAAQAAKEFERVAASTTILVISSVDVTGRPTSRLMHFVKSGRAGVWYVATPPERPRVSEFDEGKVAIVTLPTEGGGTINSNRMAITRAPFALDKVADLFEAQIPGFLDGLTEAEQQRELVYELTFQSARVDTWLDHDEVQFFDPR